MPESLKPGKEDSKKEAVEKPIAAAAAAAAPESEQEVMEQVKK